MGGNGLASGSGTIPITLMTKVIKTPQPDPFDLDDSHLLIGYRFSGVLPSRKPVAVNGTKPSPRRRASKAVSRPVIRARAANGPK